MTPEPEKKNAEDHLKNLISQSGPLPVADFMGLALTHPQYGYYTGGQVLGREGDFVTAPEISQVFGELIGIWAISVWQLMGSPARFNLVELGPGRGTLMADLLRASRLMPDFAKALDIHMVEASPALRERQRALVDKPIQHHDVLDSLPADGPIICIANEFFDALPARQYQKTGRGWHERVVDLNPNGDLRFALSPTSLANAQTVLGTRIKGAALGSLVEISPTSEAIMTDLAGRIADQGGAALIIDYGPAKSGCGESLQAVKDHHYHDVLQDVGSADLTVHVDFERLADAARSAGTLTKPITSQRDFLIAMGIEARTTALLKFAKTHQDADLLKQGTDRLIAPDQMGDLFKVLAILHPAFGNVPPVPGFSE